MKRYIRTISFLQALLIIGLFSLACSMVFSYLQYDMAHAHLRTLIQAVSLAGDEVTPAQLAGQLTQEDPALRVTLMSADGTVLCDTQATGDVENHLSRKEVQEALAGEWGWDIRYSRTTRVPSLYVARLNPTGEVLRLGYPLSAINQFVNGLLIIALCMCALVLALTHVAAGHFADRLMRPLRQIERALQDTSGTVPALPADRMFPEVNAIVSNIGAKIEKLHYDIAEVQRTMRVRSDFVANASHELKSPLTSIRGFAELLETGTIKDEARQREFLGRIIRESNRLLSIIEDILLLSRAERGEPANVADVDLRELALRITAALDGQAAARHISLEVAGSGHIQANPQDMWGLLYNLVDNGIRYGREGGFVRVRIDPGCVTVLDNGIGIPADQLPRVFERFYRVDKSHSRETGGTGLGLSIARNLALKYHGRLSVDSTEGEGSTFTFRF